jgi:hypothetical protein
MDALPGSSGHSLDIARANELNEGGDSDGLRYLDGPMFCYAILAERSGTCIQKEIRRSNLE